MRKRALVLLALLMILMAKPHNLFAQSVRGPEITSIQNGWMSAIYPWHYIKKWARNHPLPGFWKVDERQTASEVRFQTETFAQFGSAVDVLEYNPEPLSGDHNQWLATYFENLALENRPFFLLYDYAFRGDFVRDEHNRINVDNALNRSILDADFTFMRREVINRWPKRYVVHQGRPVIYFWAVNNLTGGVTNFLDEMRTKHSLSFIGSVNIMSLASDGAEWENFRGFDGFMEFALLPPVCPDGKRRYADIEPVLDQGLTLLTEKIREWERDPKRKYFIIPTMQFAYDDRNYPGREGQVPVYGTEPEVDSLASYISRWRARGKFSGPTFIVGSELFEGMSVLPFECVTEPSEASGQFIGCGYGRLEKARKFFSR